MKLRRLRFEAIGHRDARLAPLLLDFTGDPGSAALDTVLWLRNGGGKSSILNLFYSLLRPDRREFLGSETEGRQRRLEDYVAADDTAHVVAEWEVPGAGLPGMGDTTLVTGMVLEWRERAKSADPGRLRRAWYAFSARPGSLTMDTLPFRIDTDRSVNGDGDGSGVRRATGLTRFCDLLRDAARAHPALELSISEAQGEWQRRLTNLGLDPELYRYQLRMNRREGGAAELFRFRDAGEFVDFLLELVVDPTEPGQVAANLAQYADELARRPALELEREFVDGSISRLRVLVEALNGRATMLARLAEAWKVGEDRRQSFELTGAAARQRAIEMGDESSRLREASKEHDRQRGRLNDQAAEMRRVAADLRLQAAQGSLEAARLQEAAAGETVEAWAAAEVLARRRAAAEQLATLDTELARIEEATAPLREERAVAARNLTARLEALRTAAALQAATEAAEAERADGVAQTCNDRRIACEVGKKDADGQLAIIARRRTEAESERRALEAAAGILPGEPPASALVRVTDEERALAEAEARGEEKQSVIAATREELAAERLEVAQELTRSGGARDNLAARIDTLRARIEELAGAHRLIELSEADVIDLWISGPVLLERLSRLIEHADADLVALEIGGLEDRRALAALEDGGLLPPTLDVEKVLAVLEGAGIPAASGWEYLAESVASDHRDEAIASSPELAAGVIVMPRALVAARAALDTAGLVLSTAVTIGITGGLEDGAPTDADRFVLAPARALYDPGAAEAELAARVIDVESLDARRSELVQAREEDATIREDLRRFLTEFREGTVEGWQRELQHLEGNGVRLRQRVEAIRETDGELAAELAGILDKLRESRQRRRAIAELTPKLQLCARHLTDVEALGPEEQVLRHRRDELVAEIGQALAEERQWRTRRAEAELRRAESAAAAGRLAEERARVEVDGEPGDDPPPEHPLEALRAQYRAIDERYRGIVGNNVLADRRSSTARSIAELDRQLSEEPMASMVPLAGEILAIAGNGEPDQRAAGQRRAKTTRDKAIAARARSEAGVEQAKRDVRSVAAPDGRRMELPAELRTDDPSVAQEWAERLAADASTASERATAAEKAAVAAEREGQDAEREVERMTGLASRLSTALAHHREAAAAGVEGAEARTAVWPFDGPYDEAKRVTDAALQALERAGIEHADASKQVTDVAGAVHRFALGDRFVDLKGKLRDRLVLDDADTLSERASEHVAALDVRLAQLIAQLASLGEHQKLVVSALVGIVETALGHLRRAESSSRLPDALEGWAGRPFIKIAFDQPERDEELFARLGSVVDRVVAEGSAPEGLPLLLQATRAAVGRRGFEVTILKPDTVLRADRHQVTELNKFSDGEKLTATILLYCTLARLRARNRGRPETGGGMLILDNPIGTCSNVGLLNLQRHVALAMGVQLIYTTGVNDLDALATLPNCIRLRNNHRDQRTGRLHVLADDPEVPGPSLAATRVYRRDAARTP